MKRRWLELAAKWLLLVVFPSSLLAEIHWRLVRVANRPMPACVLCWLGLAPDMPSGEGCGSEEHASLASGPRKHQDKVQVVVLMSIKSEGPFWLARTAA